MSFDQPVVLIMSANPKPNHTLIPEFTERPIADSHTKGAQWTYLFESQRGVAWVLFQYLEILVGKLLDRRREQTVVKPKIWSGEVLHNSTHRPAMNS